MSQIEQLYDGKVKGVNYRLDLDEYQMLEVYYGLLNGVDTSLYNDGRFDYKQMYEIRVGLENGVNVSIVEYNWVMTRSKRRALKQGEL